MFPKGDNLKSIFIDGRYALQRRLSISEVGAVYLSEDHLRSSRPLVLKLFAAADAHSAQLLAKQAQALSLLRHPNLIRILSFGMDPVWGTYWLMERAEGCNLSQMLRKQHGGLSVQRTLQIMLPIVRATAFMHAQNFFHGDIKPENIMVGSGEDHCQLIDLPLPVGLQQGQGTPDFMAPEQVVAGLCNAQTDIYALGATLYTLLFGKPPFVRPHRGAVMLAQVYEEASLPKRWQRAHPQLAAIILRCLHKDSEQRFGSCQELAFALGEVYQSYDAELQATKLYILPHGTEGLSPAPMVAATLPRRKSLLRKAITMAVVMLCGGGLPIGTSHEQDIQKQTQPLLLRFDSRPQGAMVLFENHVLCSHTPCEIRWHRQLGNLPRSLMVQMRHISPHCQTLPPQPIELNASVVEFSQRLACVPGS